VEQKDWRVRCDRIEFADRREASFDELVLGETADDTNPLWRWGDGHLPLQHRHRIGEASHAVPTQLHVEVEAATDDVQVVVHEARQGDDDFGAALGLEHLIIIATDCREYSICNCNGGGVRVRAV
jgi:hypothetical protein